MKQVYCAGSLGDTFTIGLKLMKESDDFEIYHHTRLKFWYNEIRNIYYMFDNIKKVEFVEFLYPDLKEISGIPEEGMVWFPELDLPYVPICGESYIAMFPHAGREDIMARKINVQYIEKMIDMLSPVPVILLGTDERYKSIKCYENLIGQTSIEQATSIIIDSSGFCGPEGFPAFVALSHRKPSVIFYVREQPVEARLLNNPWTDYIIDLIKIRS